LEYLGATTCDLDELVKLAQDYTKKNWTYNFWWRNCRTLVDYLIDKIPEFATLPRKNGSVLEHYHHDYKNRRSSVHDSQMDRFGQLLESKSWLAFGSEEETDSQNVSLSSS